MFGEIQMELYSHSNWSKETRAGGGVSSGRVEAAWATEATLSTFIVWLFPVVCPIVLCHCVVMCEHFRLSASGLSLCQAQSEWLEGPG